MAGFRAVSAQQRPEPRQLRRAQGTDQRPAEAGAARWSTRSFEVQAVGTLPLDLEEVRVAGERDAGVPELASVLSTGNPGEHRAEEGDVVDVNGWRADALADLVHAGVVAGSQRLVVLV